MTICSTYVDNHSHSCECLLVPWAVGIRVSRGVMVEIIGEMCPVADHRTCKLTTCYIDEILVSGINN